MIGFLLKAGKVNIIGAVSVLVAAVAVFDWSGGIRSKAVANPG
jgi:hypothetical protein